MALNLITEAQKWAQNNGMIYKQLSEYHHRVQNIDSGLFVDFWTSGKYQNIDRKVSTAQTVSEFVAALQKLTEQDQPIATTAIATTMKPKKLDHRAPVTKSTKFRIKKWMGEHH